MEKPWQVGRKMALMLVTAAGLSQAAMAAATDERIHQPGTAARTASSPDARAASAPAPRPSARDTGPSTTKPGSTAEASGAGTAAGPGGSADMRGEPARKR